MIQNTYLILNDFLLAEAPVEDPRASSSVSSTPSNMSTTDRSIAMHLGVMLQKCQTTMDSLLT